MMVHEKKAAGFIIQFLKTTADKYDMKQQCIEGYQNLVKIKSQFKISLRMRTHRQ